MVLMVVFAVKNQTGIVANVERHDKLNYTSNLMSDFTTDYELLTESLDDSIPLTDEQELALDSIFDFVERGVSGEVFIQYCQGGYAGTGKTTLIKELIKELRQRGCYTVVSSFTGKAVNVLQRKGVSAQTMHSLMYDPVEDRDGNITFVKKTSLKSDPDLIIIDEASMVSTDLYRDLKSFDVPVLFVGDPGQLEPVGDNPNLMSKPDFVLSKIHRQAEGNPIIKFATDIRLGRVGKPVIGEWFDKLIIKPKIVRASEYLAANQVICAKNKTRKDLNNKLRIQLGYRDLLVKGEKLICLRNNRMRGLFNGMVLFVDEILAEGATYWLCALHDEVGFKYREKVWKEPFTMPLVQDAKVPFEHTYCDYGYVITCHKSQGSEWEHVLVVDEWMPPQVWDMKRWRYTAITRASKRLVYCI